MEQLAEAANVSRRTLFNHFPSKYDAIMGEHPVFEGAAEMAECESGGPTGNLLDDLLICVRPVLSGIDETPARLAEQQQILCSSPSLIAHATKALDARFSQLHEHFLARDPQADLRQTAILLAALIGVGHLSMTEFLEGSGDASFADVFVRNVESLRHMVR